jgi:Na+-translocating ferredoxin:NAD+ oxidoreductase RnfG subunit
VREMLKLGLVLGVVSAVTAGGLAAVNSAVKATIAENNRLEAVLKRQQVFPAAKDFEPRTVDGREVFLARDAAGATLGLVVTAAPRDCPVRGDADRHADRAGIAAGLAISKLDQTETPGTPQGSP